MNRRAGYPLAVLLLIAALTLACAPTFSAAPMTPLPTFDLHELGTAIAGTARAAATETFLHVTPSSTPTSTPTRTFTPASTVTLTPSITPSFTPTATETFVYLLNTPTPYNGSPDTSTPRPAGKRVPTKEKEVEPKPYDCSLVSQSPALYTVMPRGTKFTMAWTVKNTSMPWQVNSVDYLYYGGAMMQTQSLYDLPTTVSFREKVTLKVAMVAPKKPGKYASTWRLKRGQDLFCWLVAAIEVK